MFARSSNAIFVGANNGVRTIISDSNITTNYINGSSNTDNTLSFTNATNTCVILFIYD